MEWTTRFSRDQEVLFSHIREWRIDGVELLLSPEELANIVSVRQTLDLLKFELTACSVLPRDFHLVSAQREIRTFGVDYLKRCVERTAKLGARRAAELEISRCTEPLNRFQTYFLNTQEDAVRQPRSKR